MSPARYAWYYNLWRDEILRVAAGKAAARRPPILFMPGGLWTFEGYPDCLRDVLNQGLEVAIGRITARVPTGVRYCRFLFGRVPCGVRTAQLDISSGVDVKGRMYTNTMGYYRDFLNAVGPNKVDIGNLHFCPYVDQDAQFGEGDVRAVVANLNAMAEEVADSASQGQVWLTELGNFNPYDDFDTAGRLVLPLLETFRTSISPAVTRWYWFRAKGEDSKFDMFPEPEAAPLLAIGAFLGTDVANRLRPIVSVEKPVVSWSDRIALTALLTRYAAQHPSQGLLDEDGNPRPMAGMYVSYARAFVGIRTGVSEIAVGATGQSLTRLLIT